MKTRYFLLIFTISCWACTNIEDATPSERNTFIHFYETTHNVSGVAVAVTDNGYVLLASETMPSGTINGLVIRTDKLGNETADRITLPRFTPKAMKAGAQGYFITGDRVKLFPQSPNVFDFTVTSAVLYRVSLQGSDTASYVLTDPQGSAKTDYHGSSVTINSTNQVILLGSFKKAETNALERPFISAIDPTTLAPAWYKPYEVLERDYVNSKAVHATADGNIIWTSALLRTAGDLSRSYLTAPYTKENSTFINNAVFADETDQAIYPRDMQPAKTAEFGYGVIGTYAQTNGSLSNMFFIRVDRNGNFSAGSTRFFDGEQGLTNTTVEPGISSSEDTGDAITSTQDGGFMLAGTMLTTTKRGNGNRDIFLVKVTGLGDMVWNKIIGGQGDETVSSIRETADGSLVICGSNNLSGLSSAFIIKTDKNGELKD